MKIQTAWGLTWSREEKESEFSELSEYKQEILTRLSSYVNEDHEAEEAIKKICISLPVFKQHELPVMYEWLFVKTDCINPENELHRESRKQLRPVAEILANRWVHRELNRQTRQVVQALLVDRPDFVEKLTRCMHKWLAKLGFIYETVAGCRTGGSAASQWEVVHAWMWDIRVKVKDGLNVNGHLPVVQSDEISRGIYDRIEEDECAYNYTLRSVRVDMPRMAKLVYGNGLMEKLVYGNGLTAAVKYRTDDGSVVILLKNNTMKHAMSPALASVIRGLSRHAYGKVEDEDSRLARVEAFREVGLLGLMNDGAYYLTKVVSKAIRGRHKYPYHLGDVMECCMNLRKLEKWFPDVFPVPRYLPDEFNLTEIEVVAGKEKLKEWLHLQTMLQELER